MLFFGFRVMNTLPKGHSPRRKTKEDFYMEIRYNVTGDKRKALVKVVSDTTGARAVYKYMPTCNYEIDYFTVTKDGTLLFDDRADSEEVEKVLEAIAAAGFDCEPADRTEDAATEAEQDAPDAEAEESAQEAADAATEPDSADETGLTVSLPLDGFNPDSLDRLQKLTDSKAALIKKALGADRLTIQASDGTVRFPWWDTLPAPEETMAFTAFIAALCKMAKESKRVTATEKDVESEKYAFRGFLLRLGFIGADSKNQRKLLLKNLSGSAAFPNKEKADAFSAAQKAKRDAAKVAASAEEVTA